VVDAEAEPARVTVGGGNVVHVEEDGGRRLGVHAAAERLLPRGPGLRGGAPRDAHPPTRRAPPPPRPSRAALALDGAARRLRCFALLCPRLALRNPQGASGLASWRDKGIATRVARVSSNRAVVRAVEMARIS
jgi:hypothetical protein